MYKENKIEKHVWEKTEKPSNEFSYVIFKSHTLMQKMGQI